MADNIQITIENVHIRFEDSLSAQPSWSTESVPQRCFSLGLVLDRLTLQGAVRPHTHK